MAKKKSIYSILTIVMLLVCTMLFSACGSVSSTIITYDDGSIEERVAITIKPEEVINKVEDLSEFKTDVELDGKYVLESLVDSYKAELMNDVNTNHEFVMEYFYELNNGISYDCKTWSDNSILFMLKFKNIYAYRYYYGIKEEIKNTEMDKEKHFLYTKYSQKGSTLFERYSRLYEVCENAYSTKYPDLINMNSGELLYIYQTDLRREHSNADYIEKINGMYYHTWVVDQADLETDMTMYYIVANRGVGMLMCIGVTLVAVGIMLLIVFINKNKKEKNNKNLNLFQKLIEKYENTIKNH